MCGIFGAINTRGVFSPDDQRRFAGLNDLVSYRGPDASGQKTLLLKPGAKADGGSFDVFLGHRRLSIIDLSVAGNQPMTDGNGLWIAFNGEIFNYIELREELKQKGHEFKTNTDTEVILKLYREYGSEGFSRLNGMWAFALVDIAKKQVVLSRDRFSIKPLYYATANGALYFGSEIKQLLPLLGSVRLNERQMLVFLRQKQLDFDDDTFFVGVKKVRAKTNLIVRLDSGALSEQQYWDYEPEETKDFAAAIERFRELFIDSVRIRLRSDVKVGALLSGGLDSSAITVVADSLQEGNFESFSVVSQDKRFSEERFIDALVGERRVGNSKFVFEPSKVLETIDEVVYHNDEPFGGLSVVAQYNVLKMIKERTGVIVVLSGQGGDETMMGYLKYFFFHVKGLLRQGAYVEAAREIAASIIKRTVVWQFNMLEARRYMSKAAAGSGSHYLRLKGELEPIWQAGDMRKRQMSDIDKYSVPSLTHYEDRNSMAHSLEIRLPFLDHRLINFLVGLPPSFKIKDGWTKYIMRASLDELPERIRWRRDKLGFVTPEKEWLKNDLSGIIHNHFANSRLAALGVIDAKAFLDVYGRFTNGSNAIGHAEVARVFIAELWARRFLS